MNNELYLKVEKLYFVMFGKPKTHGEWAKGFNIRHKMYTVLNNA